VAGPTEQACEFLDKVCLAASSAEHGCTNCPTWDLEIEGTLDPEHLRTALGWLVQRYWPIRSRMEPVGDKELLAARRLRFVVSPSLDVDEILEVVDTDAEGLIQVQGQVRDRHLDWTQTWPLRLTLARVGTERAHLMVQQHHGLADGRAFMEMLDDLSDYLRHAAAGTTPEDLSPVARRDEVTPIVRGAWRARWWTLVGWCWLVGLILRGIFRPLKPLWQNEATDYRGPNRTVHLDMDAALIDGWRPRWRQAGLSLNTVLTGALFLANQRWNLEHGVTAGKTNAWLIAETRPRDGSYDSFANHLASLIVDLPLHRDLPILDQLRRVHGQAKFRGRHKLHLKRHLFERAIGLAIPLGWLRKALLEPEPVPVNLNFSNLIPLTFPDLGGQRWRCPRVHITTPVSPRCAVVLTVIRYRGRLTFNFNHKASLVARPDVERLVQLFREALDDVIAALPPAQD